MIKEEKIQAIKNGIARWITHAIQEISCIEDKRTLIDVKKYFTNEDNIFGGYIQHYYPEYIEVGTYRDSFYTMSTKPLITKVVRYEDLDDTEIDAIYKKFVP